MKELIFEIIHEWQDSMLDTDAIVHQVYMDESNYNNADITSNQPVHTKAELYELVEQCIDELNERLLK